MKTLNLYLCRKCKFMAIGNLPVRALKSCCEEWFANISKSLIEDVLNTIKYDNLNPIIDYNCDKNRILDIGDIKNDQIRLFENYNQFLWCTAYHLLVIFDNCIQKPMIEKTYIGKFSYDTKEEQIACAIFLAGRKLLTGYVQDVFYKLPNCEQVCEDFSDTIGNTNGIFVAGISFIVAHEFAHKYLGHTDEIMNNENSVELELAADDFAIACIKNTFDREDGFNYKLGIITVLSSFLLMGKDSLIGGESHPDWDERMKNAIEKLEIIKGDALWGIAGFPMVMWMNNFKEFGDDKWPDGFDTHDEAFCFYLSQITQIKKRLFPKQCKPSWDT